MSSIPQHRRILIAILFLSVFLRVAVAFYLGDTVAESRGGTADQYSYDTLAMRVVDGHGFSFARRWWPATAAEAPTAHWSYLYTGFLAGIYAMAGHHPLAARLVQAVLAGALMPWLAYRLGRRTYGPTVGLVSAALIAFYAYFILFSASLMTEAFYTITLLWLVDAAQRLAAQMAAGRSGRIVPPGVELGLAIGASLLLRQVGFFLVLVVVAWLLWRAWRHDVLRRATAVLALASGVTLLLLLPWTARNYNAFGTLSLWPNTNSGFALYWANHPVYGTQFKTVLYPEDGVTYQQLIPPELRSLNEAQLDGALRTLGMRFILDDLDRFALLSLSRIPVQFQFWPTADSSLLSNASRVLSFGLALPLILSGVLLFLVRGSTHIARRSFWRRRATWTAVDERIAGGWLLLALIAVYNVLHILSWAKVRYRLPTDAFMLIFAAAALVWLTGRLRRRSSLGSSV